MMYSYALALPLPFGRDTQTHTSSRESKTHAEQHLFETNNIASTVNKQHQIAFYFVPFILFCDASTSTIHHSLSSSPSCDGSIGDGGGQDTQVSLSFSNAYIVPYIFSGVFACRFNSFWSSLVARHPSPVARSRSRSCCFCRLCRSVHFIFLSFRFFSALFLSLSVHGRLMVIVLRVQSAICHTVETKCRDEGWLPDKPIWNKTHDEVCSYS